MRRAIQVSILAAAVALVSAPAQVFAEGYVSPWVGVNFGNEPAVDLDEELDGGRAAFGVSGGWMGAGIIGGEVDFGYSPSFFGTETDFGNNTLLTVMGNLIIGVPVGGTTGGGVRPYVTGGVGLIRTQIDGGDLFNIESSNNDFGWNLGAGVMGFFNDHVGLRGDVRYMRSLVSEDDDIDDGDFDFPDFDQGDLDFWRLTVGVVFR
jgi:opacity protein-like surface antigen